MDFASDLSSDGVTGKERAPVYAEACLRSLIEVPSVQCNILSKGIPAVRTESNVIP